jgi:hypothetical protein
MKHAIHTLKLAGLVSAFALRATAIEAPPEEPQAQAPAAPDEQAAPKVEQMPLQQEKAAVSAYLGLGSSQVPEILGVHLGLKEGEGTLVRVLDPEGPAIKAGFTVNDVITKIDETAVGSHADLTKHVSGKKPGDEVSIDYIHEGKPGNRKVILGERAERAIGMNGAGDQPLDRLLQDMPQDQARKIRESIERSIKGAGDIQGMLQLQGEAAAPEMDKAMKEMQKKVEKMLGGAAAGGAGMPQQMNFQSASTIRLLDEKGSVELKSKDGGKEVRVLDKEGNEAWSGPWDTEQDKAAAPAEVRSRIERLNIDMDFKGNGLRLRMQPQIVPPVPDE